MFELIRNYLLSIRRSPLFDAKLATRIFSFVVFGQFVISFVFIGFILNKILMLVAPDIAPIDTFSRIFLFLFVVDIVFKFFFKSYKHIDVLPYLTLPVSRKKIYTLLFVKELFSGWNFIWVAILTPFFLKTVYLDGGLFSVCLLIFSVYFISVTISIVIRYVDVLSTWKSSLFSFLPLLLAVCVGYVSYYIAVFSDLLIDVNLIFSQYKLWASFVLVLLFLCLFLIFLKSNRQELYAQLTGKKKLAISFTLNLNNWGLKGEIVKFCLRELTRSQLKRQLLAYILFIVCGLMISFDGKVDFWVQCFYILLPIIILGSILGEYSFGAESTFFDKLMTSPENIPWLILKTKYIICVVLAALIPAIHIAANMIVNINNVPLLFHISVFFFGCGIMLFFIFQTVAYNRQRVDILGSVRKMTNFTFQSFLFMVFIVLSFSIILLIRKLSSETTANYVMLTTGIVMTAVSPFWLKNIYKRFLLRKHKNITGFRDTK